MQDMIEGFPLSPQQKRLWLLQQNSLAYRAQLAILIDGNLKVEVLKEALQELVNQHEILHTTFHSLAGMKFPIQVIENRSSLQWQEYDLSSFDIEKQKASIEELFREQGQRPFNLQQDPLLRLTILTLSTHRHILLVSLPSLCADISTLSHLVQEISRFYARSKQTELDEAPVQYVQFSAWQNELLEAEDAETGTDYWRKQDISHLLDLKLPFETQLTESLEFKPQFIALTIQPHTHRKIEALVQEHEISTSVFLLACWQILLRRLTLQSDIVVGSACDGRSYEELEGEIGLLTKYLPVHCHLEDNFPFSQVLRQVDESAHEAYSGYEYFAWEQTLGRTEYIDFMLSSLFCFDFEQQKAKFFADDVSFSIYKQYACVDRFKVKLSCIDRGDVLVAEFHYDSNLFSHKDIERLAEQFHTLLESVVSNPKASISELEILSNVERQQLLVEFNETGQDYSQDKCIHHLIEEQVERTLDNIAVIFKEQQLTYQELNARANQLAHYLQTLGVGSDTLVGICVERSLSMIVGILGILKAGGAYVPINPAYPNERLAYMLEDSHVPVLLTQQMLVESLPEHRVQVICLDADWDVIAQQSNDNPVSGVMADNLAYIIYTSGSTGQPKGVEITHQNLVHSTLARILYYDKPVTNFLLTSPFAFDSSVAGIFWTLCQGGTLSLPQENFQSDILQFIQLIGQRRISHLLCIPSLYKLILDHVEPQQLVELQSVTVAGESCPKELVERHRKLLPQISLFNEYGPTEGTVWSSVYNCHSHAPKNSIPIGRAIANTQIYLLDSHLQLVPIGVPGELHIGGLGLARGYLNRPELTAEKFIPNPFSNEPKARLYKTGDLARYLADGNLEFLGRIDYQVKIRGFRIELGEIEALLDQHPDLQEVVVVAQEGINGDKLVAYVVPSRKQAPTTSELRRFLKDKLPEYMIPSTFVVLKALPLTPNGKIDRRALLANNQIRPELEQGFVAPRTLIEQTLAEIWSQVFGLKQIGVHDNFFELGGDSILSIQILSRANERGLNFSLQQLSLHPTIDELAQFVKTVEARSLTIHQSLPFSLISKQDDLRIPHDVEDAYPLTMLQAGMFFHSEYTPDSTIYYDIVSLHLQVPFNIQALQAGLKELVGRHPILRTSFDFTNFSEPLQLVHQNASIPLAVHDLRHLSDAGQEEILDALIEAEKSRKFDLKSAPLLRFQIHHRSEETFQLTYTCHHAILDGWSAASMLTELFQHYLNILGNKTRPIAPRPTATFRDYVALERESVKSEDNRRYWTQKLNDSTVTMLPRWSSSCQVVDVEQHHLQTVPISLELSEDLKRLAQFTGVPLKSVLLAAHLRVLNLLSGQSDIQIGLVSNVRPEEVDSERVLGLFLNTLPFRLQLPGGTWIDLIQATFQTECELLPFRWYPMAELQRIKGGQPLFETAFNFVHFHVAQGVLELEGIEYLGNKSYNPTNLTLLVSFGLHPTSSQVILDLEYDGTKLCEEQIQRICEYYVKTLTAMACEPLGRYETHSLLSEQERYQLLVEWNETKTNYPDDQCIHELFEAQVEQTPDAVAVVFADEIVTYHELNTKANQLAHYLRSFGVKPEVLVGICVERSVEMVVGLLGILKAGGAYVPLDPAYPQERLAFMLEDAQVSLLLTTEKLATRLPEYGSQVVFLDTDWGVISYESGTNLVISATPEHLAYVVYTSGSTGKPKGVMIAHQSLVNFTKTATVEYGLSQSDRVLQFASINFDTAAEEIYPCLTCGGILVLRTNEMLNSVPEFLQKSSDLELTVLDLPTAYWHLVTSELAIADLVLPDSLRLVIIGGEKALPQAVEIWQKRVRTISLVNTYGPTEATVVATLCKLSGLASVEIHNKVVPIGRPIHNVQVYVLDQNLQPVPIGVPGKLYIGGAPLARGYLNRLDLTKEKFIPNPFSHEQGARLYKTGDLVRYLPDGNIEYLGRIDNQVKIRGFRIEMGEIEAVLNTHPQIQQAVVIATEEVSGNKRLVAYVVTSDESLTTNQLREFLKQQLPEYMMPSAFVTLDTLPLTPNGKVDHKALPAPDGEINCEHVKVIPRTPSEEIIANIFAAVLGVQNVGIHDNFFTNGGHSLLATQLISRLRLAFEVEIPIRAVFESPTVTQLEKTITQLRTIERGLTLPPIQPIKGDIEQLPLSWAQERLWFLDQLEGSIATYNIPLSVRMTGNLDLNALQQALSEIVRRHSVLRTSFQTVNGTPTQVIHPEATININVVDLQQLLTTERETVQKQLALEEAMIPFDLKIAPLIRCSRVQLSAKECVLLLTTHHIVFDGWSIGIFINELTTLYSAFCNGQPSPLPELTIQYADFAVWQREWLLSEVLQSQLAYWRQQLANLSILQLPRDQPRATAQTFSGTQQPLLLTNTLSETIKALSLQEGVTLFMTLLTAFKILLYYYTVQDDIVVGTDVANRNRIETEQLIGFFVNQLVLRTNLSGNPTFKELLERVRQVTLDAYTYQDMPFDKLVADLNPNRNLSHTPLFQAKFVFQNAPISDLELSNLTLSLLEVDNGTAKFDLLLTMWDAEEGLAGSLQYRTDLFNAATIARILENFETILNTATIQPNVRLNDLVKILVDADKQKRAEKQKEFRQTRRSKFKSVKPQLINEASIEADI